MKKLILTAALGATTLAGAACAQTATDDAPIPAPRMHHGMRGGMGPGAIMRADLNHDGVVTRAEASAAADQRFAALDADHDGTVTRDERRAGMAERRQAWRDQQGGDRATGDAMAPAPGMRAGRDQTQADFRDRALRQFDRVDTNHNGQVDRNEIEAARLVMRARRDGGDMPPPPNDSSDDQ